MMNLRGYGSEESNRWRSRLQCARNGWHRAMVNTKRFSPRRSFLPKWRQVTASSVTSTVRIGHARYNATLSVDLVEVFKWCPSLLQLLMLISFMYLQSWPHLPLSVFWRRRCTILFFCRWWTSIWIFWQSSIWKQNSWRSMQKRAHSWQKDWKFSCYQHLHLWKEAKWKTMWYSPFFVGLVLYVHCLYNSLLCTHLYLFSVKLVVVSVGGGIVGGTCLSWPQKECVAYLVAWSWFHLE